MLAALGLIAILIPSEQAKNPQASPSKGPAQLAVAPRLRLSATDRHAIDITLDRFLPAGLTGKSPATAWALAGPELRSGSTLADWRAGTSPIPYYPVLETTFHGWRTIDVGPRYVIFNLLVHPKPGAQVPTTVFSGEVVKQGNRWLVNRLYTIATMNPVTRTTREVGPADFAAPPPASQAPEGKPVRRVGIVPVLSILALILLLPLSFGGVALVRAWRWRARVRAAESTDLPPLPSGYRPRA